LVVETGPWRDERLERTVPFTLSLALTTPPASIRNTGAYNRLARLTLAPLLALLRDDHAPPVDDRWLAHARLLFAAVPQLGVLGGATGKLDVGLLIDPRSHTVSGPMFRGGGVGAAHQPIKHTEPHTNVPFMYVYKVRGRAACLSALF
jgi:hypothetical protein